ncbi:unnamed protein product [Arctogadus glacialis]
MILRIPRSPGGLREAFLFPSLRDGRPLWEASVISPLIRPALVPTVEASSVSPSSSPETRPPAVATTTFAPNATAVPGAGADPRDGRDPMEGPRGSPTAHPTAAGAPPTPRRFCEATRRRAIDWPQTHTGSAVDRPCPKGTRVGPSLVHGVHLS